MPVGRVVVVGGGVMGAAAAWQLACRGVDVTLLEQFGPGHERGASHGSSRIFRLAYTDAEYVTLAERAYAGWRQLEEATSTDVLTLTGAVDHGHPAQLRALRSALAAAGAEASLLTSDEAVRRWPGLRFDGAALFHPRAGRLHADRAVAALKAAALDLGADVRHHVTVTAISAVGTGGVRIATSHGAGLDADAAVVAAGAWTRRLLAGDDAVALPPFRVTLEQPAHFAPVDPGSPWPSFIHHPGAGFAGPGGSAAYGLGSDDGVKVGFHAVGPDVDVDRAERPVDGERLARLVEYVRAWVPGVDADSAAPITCTYTLTPDEHFVVDRSGPITVLAGFSGHGFKFAPAIGELAARLVLDGATAMPIFALGRRPTPEAKPVIR